MKIRIGDNVVALRPQMFSFDESLLNWDWPKRAVGKVVSTRGDKAVVSVYGIEHEYPVYRLMHYIPGRHRRRPFPGGSRSVYNGSV